MIVRTTVASGILGAAVQAAQPEAVKAVPAPMRDLVWGDLNFLHTTDTHSWLGGHFNEPQYSADWGDYISFSHHMRQKADENHVDLLVVDTGDRIEGNGLYDASKPKGYYQYSLYAEQDVDIICTGNHELYRRYSVDMEHNTTVPNYKDNYIASNLDYIDPETGDQVPQAQRFRRFTTKNKGYDVIAMGFLFDFTGNANNSVVRPVEEVVESDWFQDVLKESPDVFVIIGHVGVRMEEFRTIFTAIRKANWASPIAFFGGHAHVRDAISYGADSFAMASGRYMETIGWMSIDGLKKRSKSLLSKASPKFSRRYIDNNLFGMYHHTGLNETTFPTEHGTNVSKAIHQARKEMNLDRLYGCAPQSYWMSRVKYPSQDSIYSLIEDQVFPEVVINQDRKNRSRIAIINTGGIRFDIFKGRFTRDSTFTISPFVSEFKYVPDVPYEIAQRVIGLLNSGDRILGTNGLESNFMASPEQFLASVHAKVQEDEEEDEEDDARLELRSVQEPLDSFGSEPDLIPGHVTKDDIGKDGDDTIHEAIKTYKLPNAIQSEINFPKDGAPDKVDVVFIDFVQPWIISALKFSGGSYDDADVRDYMEGTFTEKLAGWVQDNWGSKCS